MPKPLIKELKKLSKEHEYQGLFRNWIYSPFYIYITSLLVNTRITPNMVTSFSLILAFIAAFFYYRADYTSLVIGTIFLNLSLIFDFVDGALARYKKLDSNFGNWWDCLCNGIVEYTVLISLTLGLYFKTMDTTVLILGLFALPNLMMISFIRGLNKSYLKVKQKSEFRVMKMYIGSDETLVVLVTIATLLNKVYYLLLLYAVIGAVIWVRQIYRAIISNNAEKNLPS